MKIDPQHGPRPATPATDNGVNRIQGKTLAPAQSESSASLRYVDVAQDSAQDIDVQRVNELRQSIADGQFTIDTSRIAAGLIGDVRTFIQE